MPAGRELIENVARALDPDKAMYSADIEFYLPEPKPTRRAIRYAVAALIRQGRAKRIKRGDHTSGPVLAKPVEQQATK